MPPRKAPSSSRSTATAPADKPTSTSGRASRPPVSRGKAPASSKGKVPGGVLPESIPEGEAVESGGAKANGADKVDKDGDALMDHPAPAAAANGSSKPSSRAERGAQTPTAQRASSRGLERRNSAVSVPASRRARGRRSVAGAPDVNALAGPMEHIRPARSVFVFGSGGMGQFGLGEETVGEIKRPRLHAWFEEQRSKETLGKGTDCGPEQVVAAGLHSLAIDENGKVWSWGVNDNAALGRKTAKVEGKTSDELEMTPAIVPRLEEEGFRAVRVAGGDSVSVAVSDAGGLKVWGSFRGDQGLIGFGGVANAKQFDPVSLKDFYDLRHLHWVSVACGNDFVVALTSKGQVYTFGSNDHNQLGRRKMGRGAASLRATDPQSVGLHDIVLVGAGNYHGFAVDKDGQVYAWGVNTHGQCGLGEAVGDVVAVPTVVPALASEAHDGAKVVSITGGDHHTLVLYDNGQVWAMGSNVDNQLGLASDHSAKEDKVHEPVQVVFPAPPEDDEDSPELSAYEDSDKYRNQGTSIVAVAAGTHNNLAVSKDGHLYAWGQGSSFQLGLGPADTEVETPTIVRNTALKGVKVLDCSAGGQHCFIVGQKQ